MAKKAKTIKAKRNTTKVKSTKLKSVKAKPARAKTVKTKPMKAKSARPKAAKVKPVRAKPTKTKPIKAKAVKSKPPILKPKKPKFSRAKVAVPKTTSKMRISPLRHLGPSEVTTPSLSVIGSGFGRTGTKSLKEALEQIGFTPCHHMHEVITHPEQVAFWQVVAAQKSVDWNKVFAGYKAQVDWPGAHVWRELSVAFPNAKVVHTVRPEEVWFKSFSRTIAKLGSTYKGLSLPPHIRDMMDAGFEMIAMQTFGGGMTDRETALAAYRLRTQQVRDAIPPERLLVFDVAEGWEPLCLFLNVPIPDTPFPHRNLSKDFWETFGGEPS